jgi:hypothetical protein
MKMRTLFSITLTLACLFSVATLPGQNIRYTVNTEIPDTLDGMIRIPPGQFKMGINESDLEALVEVFREKVKKRPLSTRLSC